MATHPWRLGSAWEASLERPDVVSRIILKRVLKMLFFAVSLVVTFPLAMAVWVEKNGWSGEEIFVALGQFLALVPGITGSYLRAAYYFLTLERCSWEVRLGFGSFFSHRAASLGRNVSVGSYCIIGTVTIDDEVMMASRVSITSGKRQHLDELGRISSVQRFDRIEIGRKTWVGEGAIILANVGPNCIVSAGAVVINDTSSGQLIAGNPGKAIRELVEIEGKTLSPITR